MEKILIKYIIYPKVYHQEVYKKYKNEVYLKRYPKANERNQKRNQKNRETHSTTQILLVKPLQIAGKNEDEGVEVCKHLELVFMGFCGFLAWKH